MCGGADYRHYIPEEKRVENRRVFFPMPHAQMPVLTRDGEIRLVQWGKREGEDPEIKVPRTGWARATSLESDYWQKHDPYNVLIPVQRFSEKGKLPRSHWFDMPENTYIMGLLINKPKKSFLYVVTNPSIGALAAIHDRMPLVVNADFSPADFDIEKQMEPEDTQQKLL